MIKFLNSITIFHIQYHKGFSISHHLSHVLSAPNIFDVYIIANTEEDWISKMDQLIANLELRRDIGNNVFKKYMGKIQLYSESLAKTAKHIYLIQINLSIIRHK